MNKNKIISLLLFFTLFSLTLTGYSRSMQEYKKCVFDHPPININRSTNMAIDRLNKFVKQFPNSKKIEVDILLNKLFKKLERRDYSIANTYFFIHKYSAALISFQNFINDFPKSSLKEKALYKICVIKYRIAINNKNKKNIFDFLDSYSEYIQLYPNSPCIKELKFFYHSLMKYYKKI
ncbi:outer membrane protein assembly factor BamD [Blattabacterium cuenoti]|uniref:outer membrane protein assembly factor BamD n=1 Tax=Blattabacterium cuenoti TaxID=1653831 RepID=UPI00163D2B8E|nr:outer membrane protein assembly factor BamD [Blattabacterium cuenoti]